MQHVSKRSAVRDDARRARGQAPVEHPVLIDDAREVHLRDDLDDAGAAHAGDAGGGGRLLESRIVGPKVGADDFEARLEGLSDRCARVRSLPAPRADRS